MKRNLAFKIGMIAILVTAAIVGVAQTSGADEDDKKKKKVKKKVEIVVEESDDDGSEGEKMAKTIMIRIDSDSTEFDFEFDFSDLEELKKQMEGMNEEIKKMIKMEVHVEGDTTIINSGKEGTKEKVIIIK